MFLILLEYTDQGGGKWRIKGGRIVGMALIAVLWEMSIMVRLNGGDWSVESRKDGNLNVD